MALDIDTLDISPIDTWIEYIPTANCKIRNTTTNRIEYAYTNNPTKINSLRENEYVPVEVNQPIYFRSKKDNSTIAITLGVLAQSFSSSSANVPGSVVLGDEYGNQATITPFGALHTATPKKQIAMKFAKKLNPEEMTIVGNPIAQFNGTMLRVQNGDSVETKRALVYEAGDTILIDFTAEFSSFGQAGDASSIGWYDEHSGILLVAEAGILKVKYRNVFANAGTAPAGTAPDIEFAINEPLLVINKLYRFNIMLAFLGVGNIAVTFKPEGKNVPYKELAVFETDGALSQRTHIGNPTVPIRAEVSGATAGDIYSGSWSASTFSEEADSIQNLPEEVRIERIVGVNSGQRLAVAAYRNKTVLAGFPNKTRSKLKSIIASTKSEGWYVIELWINPIGAIVGSSWSEVNGDYSVLEYNDTVSFVPDVNDKAKVTIDLLVQTSGQGTGETSTSVKERYLRLIPGDIAVITKRCIKEGGGSDNTAVTIIHTNEF